MIPAWYKKPDGSYGVIPPRALGVFPDGKVGFPWLLKDNEKLGIDTQQLHNFLLIIEHDNCFDRDRPNSRSVLKGRR